MRKAILAILLLVSTWGWARPVSADPVELAFPSRLNVDAGDPLEFRFFGPFGEVGGWIASPWQDNTPAGRCMPCAPGTVINLDAMIGPGDLSGRGELSNSYWDTDPSDDLAGLTHPVYWDGFLRFDTGGATFTATAGWNADPLARFTFTGELIGYLDPARTGTPVFHETFAGQGNVYLSLQPYPFDNPTALFFSSNRYEFDAAQDPVPEPATMLLAGAGLAYIGRRGLRRRARRDDAA